MPLQSFKNKNLKQNALKPSILLLKQSHFGAAYGVPIHVFGAAFNVFAKVITVMEVWSLDTGLKT